MRTRIRSPILLGLVLSALIMVRPVEDPRGGVAGLLCVCGRFSSEVRVVADNAAVSHEIEACQSGESATEILGDPAGAETPAGAWVS